MDVGAKCRAGLIRVAGSMLAGLAGLSLGLVSCPKFNKNSWRLRREAAQSPVCQSFSPRTEQSQVKVVVTPCQSTVADIDQYYKQLRSLIVYSLAVNFYNLLLTTNYKLTVSVNLTGNIIIHHGPQQTSTDILG